MRLFLGLTVPVVACGLLAGTAQAQLRVANWNISFYTGTGRVADIQAAVYGVFNGRSMSPDVLALQEFTTAAALSTFVGVLNSAPGSPGDWAAAPFITGPDTQSVLVYRTSKVDLIRALTIAVGSSASTDQPRSTYRYDLRAKGYTSANATFAIYNVHMKAGDTSADNARRLVESTNIRDNASGMDTNGAGTGLPAGYHFILAGDLNMQSAGQSSYQELISGAGGNLGRFYDPICRPGIYYTPGGGTDAGSWNNNPAFAAIHTQDPATTAGMDDRYDQILLGGTLVDSVGMDYVGNPTVRWNLNTWNDPNHSYRCWGNDGTSYNTPLTTTGNAQVGPAIAQALINCATTSGGHLPVYLDLRVPAKVAAPLTVDFGTVAQGSTATAGLTIGNGGDTALFGAAGVAALSYTLAASAGFTAPPGTFTDAAGGAVNTHTITMSTAAPGTFSGTITVTATGADAPTRTIQVTGRVLPPCGTSDFNGDGDFGTDADIEAFFACLGGTCCPTCFEGGSDFNGDGDFGTDADIESFFRVLGGSPC